MPFNPSEIPSLSDQCDHGLLKRSCEVCSVWKPRALEAEARVAELAAELDSRPHRETWMKTAEELADVKRDNVALRGIIANLQNERP